MSDETVRDLLVKAVQARLEKIRTGHVFTIPLTGRTHECATDVGTLVTPWRKIEMRKNGIVFRDGNDQTTVDGVEMGMEEHRLQFAIEVYLLEGEYTASMGRQAMADVLAAVWSDHKWGGLARFTETLGTDLGIEQAGNIVGGCTVDIAITYRCPYGEI